MKTDQNKTKITPLNKLSNAAYNTAKEKGWHDIPRPIPEILCLLHSEISEALEAYRTAKCPINENWYRKDGKPEGIPSELADLVIRVGDACIELGIDLEKAVKEKMEYNRTRPYRHGNKLA
jgi:NTP pyrophosphatase (non-canonical NTP hydrolase)